MPTLAQRIVSLMEKRPGLSDREIADALLGAGAAQQSVNQACRALVSRGVLSRAKRKDGRIGNFPLGSEVVPRTKPDQAVASPSKKTDGLTEDEVKHAIQQWLEQDGWTTTVRWGHQQGIDIEAFRPGERWVIEAKGSGSRQPMRVNYFLSMLGELLQRMNDPNARYSIALPDLPQYVALWSRLPALAKERGRISALFVSQDGSVSLEG